jgi:hypothetical protein
MKLTDLVTEALIVEAKKSKKKWKKRIPNVYSTNWPRGFVYAGIGFGSLGGSCGSSTSSGGEGGGDGGGGE